MKYTKDGVQVVLLDIEGTICCISFVKDVLFPYALKALPDVLAKQWEDPVFRPYRDAFPEEARASRQALEAHVQDLTRRDVKVAYLKNLQGYLWQTGYRNHAYATPLFPDVLPQLKTWHQGGIKLAIFSSGSVFAQKLLFEHIKDSAEQSSTTSSDQTSLISDWYDTMNGGPKAVASSYTKITKSLGHSTGTVLFLSDNVKEVEAATEAGLQAVVVDRAGNAPLSDADRSTYEVVTTLDDIHLR